MPQITKAHIEALIQNPPTEPPVLRCVRDGVQYVTEPCPYCTMTHYHGAAEDGHRASHCAEPEYVYKHGLRDAWRRAIGKGYTLVEAR